MTINESLSLSLYVQYVECALNSRWGYLTTAVKDSYFTAAITIKLKSQFNAPRNPTKQQKIAIAHIYISRTVTIYD